MRRSLAPAGVVMVGTVVTFVGIVAGDPGCELLGLALAAFGAVASLLRGGGCR